jgi:hypothetical protein
MVAMGTLLLTVAVWILADDGRTRRLATLLGRDQNRTQPPSA